MELALSAPDRDAEKAKFQQRLADKLKYCKEVLGSIRSASAQGGEEQDLPGGRELKASLR
jgi:cell cycle serine/threonine-protein kinase CDC5/MSD2